MFHITFPAEWKVSDLLHLFSPSFGPVQITWINDTSAYITLKEHLDNAKLVMSTLNCSSIYSIMPYSQYKKLEQGEVLVALKKLTDISLGVNTKFEADQTTGITPMVEKNISFSSTSSGEFENSDNSDKGDKFNIPHHIDRQNSDGKGVKRSASPFDIEKKKRTKNGDEQKVPKVFQEPSNWE